MTEKLKILMKQYQMLQKIPDMKVFLPDKTKPALWHISFRGPKDSAFQEGIYHCQLELEDYPNGAPKVMMLCPSGAFEINQHICIVGLTHYHQEGWTTGTNIEAIVTALQMYLALDRDRGGIAVIANPNPAEVKKCVGTSQTFTCKCGADHSKFGK